MPLVATAAVAHAPAVGSVEYFLHSNLFNIVLVGIFLFVILRNIQVGQKLKEFQSSVIAKIDAAEAKQAQAEEALKAIEARANAVEGEVSEILATAEKNAQALAASIIKQAEADAERMKQNAANLIATEERRKTAEIRDRLMTEAVVAARELLENTLSDDDRVRSVEQFVDQLSTAGGR